MLMFVHSKKFQPRGTQRASIKTLNRLRNEFVHFTPRVWALELNGVPVIAKLREASSASTHDGLVRNLRDVDGGEITRARQAGQRYRIAFVRLHSIPWLARDQGGGRPPST